MRATLQTRSQLACCADTARLGTATAHGRQTEGKAAPAFVTVSWQCPVQSNATMNIYSIHIAQILIHSCLHVILSPSVTNSIKKPHNFVEQ